jgi:5-methylcytosine-specific restriction endonuclease McrA
MTGAGRVNHLFDRRGSQRIVMANMLHIVQGGIDNGDKARLERASRGALRFPTWVAPKSVAVGDDVVIYVGGLGFFATARVDSAASPRPDWPNRYGAALVGIRLIRPPISLGAIKRAIPGLEWANFPRSITTPSLELADQVRALIRTRRKGGARDLGNQDLDEANLDELRTVALLKARPSVPVSERKAIYRLRSRAIHLYVLRRAGGRCEGCGKPAPFRKGDGSDYLEPHHTTRLADDGPDHPARVIGLCPNCHRRAHHSEDRAAFNARLIDRLRKLEPG